MHLSSNIQRKVAEYTSGAGHKVRRGDKFLGSGRAISEEMRHCVCGLCVSTGEKARKSCTLFDDDSQGVRVVERHQTQVCKPVCIGTSSVSLIQRLVRTLLQSVASKRTATDGFLRISLQRSVQPRSGPEHSVRPYLFDIDLFDGHLTGSFFVRVEQLGLAHDFQIPYSIGEPLDFRSILTPADFTHFRKSLERALIEGDGKSFSLVVVSNDLPPDNNFEVGHISFRSEGHGIFRARPLYLFLQAHPE